MPLKLNSANRERLSFPTPAPPHPQTFLIANEYPRHRLFLQTLGHLEKAVVLELTLKHVKALTNLIDQQQQKILALQSGLQAGERLCLARIWGGWGGSSADRAAGPAPARRNTCTVSLGQRPVSASQRSGFSSDAMGTGSWAPWLRSFWVLGVCLPASYSAKAPRVLPAVFLGLCFLAARCVACSWQGDSRSFSCISLVP